MSTAITLRTGTMLKNGDEDSEFLDWGYDLRWKLKNTLEISSAFCSKIFWQITTPKHHGRFRKLF